VKGRVVSLAYDEAGRVVRKSREFTAIPYYAWANRGRDEMVVWIPNVESAAKPTPWPTLAMKSRVSASLDAQRVTAEGIEKHPEAVNDGEEPASSSDPASYFDWWPEKGKTEWIEYTFPRTSKVSEVEVYWFDDTGHGEVRVPASWRILYKDGEQWKPVTTKDAAAIEKDKYNKLTFTPVATDAMRLEVTMQQQFSAGVEKWKVH